jgi:hypothetical protein
MHPCAKTGARHDPLIPRGCYLMLRVLSLGAGVQSSTLALMIKHGQVEPVDFAVFADTGDEPQAVYDWLDYLESLLPFPVHRISAGRLSEESTRLRTSKKSGNTYLASSIPVFVVNADGRNGMWQRHCTRNHKIDPINRFIRKHAKVPRGTKSAAVQVLVGISLDEYTRIKPSPHAWIENQWPLVDMRITRQDCLTWMETNGYPKPPRSACVFCPYKSDSEWLRLKRETPAEFAIAVQYEKRLQSAFGQATALSGVPFLHSTRQPLEEVIFSSERQSDLFNNECEGMCGV